MSKRNGSGKLCTADICSVHYRLSICIAIHACSLMRSNALYTLCVENSRWWIRTKESLFLMWFSKKMYKRTYKKFVTNISIHTHEYKQSDNEHTMLDYTEKKRCLCALFHPSKSVFLLLLKWNAHIFDACFLWCFSSFLFWRSLFI